MHLRPLFGCLQDPTKTTALCGTDDPCISQGFRVLALDLAPAARGPAWRNFRHFSLSPLRSLGLLACQVQAMIFGFLANQCVTLGLGKAVLWRHCLPRGTAAFCVMTPSRCSSIASQRNAICLIANGITHWGRDRHPSIACDRHESDRIRIRHLMLGWDRPI